MKLKSSLRNPAQATLTSHTLGNCIRHQEFSSNRQCLTQSTNSFEHHAEPGSLGSQLMSYTYPRGSSLINSRHFYQNTVLMEWFHKSPRPVSLRQLAFFGRKLTKEKLIASASFVQEELPTRLAHRIRDMQVLPFSVVSNPHICKVYEMYYQAFDKFRRVPRIDSLEKNEKFCTLLNSLLAEHLSVIPNLVMGAIECSMANSIDSKELDKFMSSILRSRISRRVIAEQHLALTASFKQDTYNHKHFHKTQKKSKHDSGELNVSDPNYIGAVFLQCSAQESISSCGQRATALIQDLYPDAVMPELIIESHPDAKFPYMRSHLDYILGELLRNSIEATVNKHYITTEESKVHGNKKPPGILVSISSTQDSVLIRISDQGGGIPEEILPHIWSFAKGPRSQYRLDNFRQVPTYAGLLQEVVTSGEQNNKTDGKEGAKQGRSAKAKEFSYGQPTTKETDFMASLSSLSSRPPELKLGMGLPLSKVYVEYWDGHIDLQSLEGYGCDVILRISRIGNQSERLQLDRV